MSCLDRRNSDLRSSTGRGTIRIYSTIYPSSPNSGRDRSTSKNLRRRVGSPSVAACRSRTNKRSITVRQRFAVIVILLGFVVGPTLHVQILAQPSSPIPGNARHAQDALQEGLEHRRRGHL